MSINYPVEPGQKRLLMATDLGIVVENNTKHDAIVSIPGQTLTTPARELKKIANSPSTDIEFLRNVAKQIYMGLQQQHPADMDNRLLAIHVVTDVQMVTTDPVEAKAASYKIVYTQE